MQSPRGLRPHAPLALQKLQEVLDLDPNNAGALSLKNSIESKRSESKIDDWFRLAPTHHCAMSVGYNIDQFQKVATLMQWPCEWMCR